MDNRICIILNPGAGGGTAGEDLRALIEDQPLKDRFEIRKSDGEGVACGLAVTAAGEGFGTVVAAGGDGTINEVINGLMQIEAVDERPRLGILPLGTGNDLARSLALPTELPEALELLSTGETRPSDVVAVGGEGEKSYSINLSAGGFSGQVGEVLSTDLKRSWGPLSYLRAAVETLSDLCDYSLEMTFDNGEREEMTALNLVVANGRYVAGGVPIAPRARLDDGLLDIIVLRSCSLPSLASLMPKILLGSHLENGEERVYYRRSRCLEVRAEPSIPFNVDGELIDHQALRFAIEPEAIRLITGPDAANAGYGDPAVAEAEESEEER